MQEQYAPFNPRNMNKIKAEILQEEIYSMIIQETLAPMLQD